MSNAQHIVENLIMGMRDGRYPLDILQDPCNQLMLESEYTTISGDEAIQIACHVVYGLYEGKFPYAEQDIQPGDLVIDSTGNHCLVTNVHSRAVHVLYPNGKTHKFPRKAKFKNTFQKIDILSFLNNIKTEEENVG